MSWVGTAELWSKGMIHVVKLLDCIVSYRTGLSTAGRLPLCQQGSHLLVC